LDLGDFVDLIYQRPEPVIGDVAGCFGLVPDFIRDRRIAHEVSARLYSDVAQFDAGCLKRLWTVSEELTNPQVPS
jgi:hypothetical protein